MNSVEDLDVFKLAHQLALKTYSATKTFPKEETYSLGRPNAKSRRIGGHESDGRCHEARYQGVPTIRWHRERLGRGSLLSITTRQRFELHFQRNLPGIAFRL